jgi:hypothetical protein
MISPTVSQVVLKMIDHKIVAMPMAENYISRKIFYAIYVNA